MNVTLALCDEEVVMRWFVYTGSLSPTTVSISHPSVSPYIRLSSAAAVMAFLLGYGLVTLPEMLLQPPASVKQSPRHFSRRALNALSKCSHPEQKLDIRGPCSITILSSLVFFSLGQYQVVLSQFAAIVLQRQNTCGCRVFCRKALPS